MLDTALAFPSKIYHRYLPEAQQVAGRIVLALRQRELAPTIQRFLLTETEHHAVWLFAVLDRERIARMEPYLASATLHQISTLVDGRPTLLSNTTGLRYAVLLTPPPSLPNEIPYPEHITPERVPLGESVHSSVIPSIGKLRNILIAGDSGSGKSNLELGLAHTARYNGWSLYLSDPDGHTFNPDMWNTLAYVPVAQAPEQLLGILGQIEAEIARRQALYRQVGQENQLPADLEAYNHIAPTPLPRMMLIVDEANSYFDHKELFTLLTDLARRGRKWGLHLVLAGHNWRAKDVPRSLSAMFPTRICFRVTDDTSGVVVLNSRIWGKRAMHLKHPGRGILLSEGQYQFLQAYRAPELSTRPDTLLPLTPLEIRLVAYALTHLDGKFIVNRLAEAFAGEGVTSHQVKTLAQAWERRGWLTPPSHATDARRVTSELMDLAGLARTGTQGAQVHSGVAYAAQEAHSDINPIF